MSAPADRAGAFDASRDCFEEALGWLEGPDAAALTHAELEDQLDCRGRGLLRRMCQGHLTLRAMTESRLEAVPDAEAVPHGAVEPGHRRPLATIFGEVDVERLAYRHRGHPNLYPADAALNLPAERHSHGLRRLAAVEATRGSFEESGHAVERATGQHVAKRQVVPVLVCGVGTGSAHVEDVVVITSSGQRTNVEGAPRLQPNGRRFH